jgi:hypothetical protein
VAEAAITDPYQRFAIIPVPYGKPPAGAIAHGPMTAISEHILGSKARAEASPAPAGQRAARGQRYESVEVLGCLPSG